MIPSFFPNQCLTLQDKSNRLSSQNKRILEKTAMLKVNNIHTYYGNIHALKG